MKTTIWIRKVAMEEWLSREDKALVIRQTLRNFKKRLEVINEDYQAVKAMYDAQNDSYEMQHTVRSSSRTSQRLSHSSVKKKADITKEVRTYLIVRSNILPSSHELGSIFFFVERGYVALCQQLGWTLQHIASLFNILVWRLIK